VSAQRVKTKNHATARFTEERDGIGRRVIHAPAVTIVRAVAFSALAAALLAGCGSGGEPTVKSVNTLLFKRADGSRIIFRGPVSVTCERARADKPPLLRVLVGRRTPEGSQPFWMLEVALDDLKRMRTFRFPKDDVAGYAILFAFDAARRQNELSSSDEEARGRLVFSTATCDEGVDFRVRAHLGSEVFDLTGADVQGRFAGPTH
jgi:hypothetical protein